MRMDILDKQRPGADTWLVAFGKTWSRHRNGTKFHYGLSAFLIQKTYFNKCREVSWLVSHAYAISSETCSGACRAMSLNAHRDISLISGSSSLPDSVRV
jgi:hypothetical protein